MSGTQGPTRAIDGLSTTVSNTASPDRYDIEQWINVEAIQLLVHHASAVVAAIVIFALVARLAIWLLPHGFVRKVVVIIDDVVLIGLLLYFGYEMLVYLWNRRPPVQRNAALGAAAPALQSYLLAYLPPPIAKPLGAAAQALVRLIAVTW